MAPISIACRNICVYRRRTWMCSNTEYSMQPCLRTFTPTATMISVILAIKYWANTRASWIKLAYTLRSFSHSNTEEFSLATVTDCAQMERSLLCIGYPQSCQITFTKKLQLLHFNPVALWTLPSRLLLLRHIYRSFMGHIFGWVPALQCAHSRSAFKSFQAARALCDLEHATKMCNLRSCDENNWKRWPNILNLSCW